MSSSYPAAGTGRAGKSVAVRGGSAVAKRASGEAAKRGVTAASKAYKFGRFLRVGGGPATLAAAATYELAKSGVDNKNKKIAQGYHQTAVPNEPGQWTPTGVHPGYAKDETAKPARKGVVKGSRYEPAAGVGSGKRTWNNLSPAAQRRLTNQRERRNARGDFKGKYYGPDELKGNISALQRWRDAGSPKDISKYIPNRSGKKSDSYLKSGKK